MNLLILSNYSPFVKHGGGAGKAIYDIANFLSSKHNVLFIYPDKEFKLTELNNNLKHLSIEGIPAYDGYIYKMGFSNNKKLLQYVSEFKPELIHTQTEGFHAQVIQKWSIKNNIPIVITLHVLPTRLTGFVGQEQSGLSFLNSGLFKRQLLTFYNSCSAVIVLNQAGLEDLRAYKFREKVKIIPNAIDRNFYFSTDEQVLNRKRKNLLFIGHLSKRKNQMYLLNLILHLPREYKLTLIGSKLENNYYNSLKEFITKNNLNVEILDPIDPDQIRSFYNSAGIFVSASTLEVQSLVILEALSSRLPIVALENQTTKEYLSSSKGLVLSLDEFINNILKISSLSDKAYLKLCNEYFNLSNKNDKEVVVDNLTDFYDDLITQKKNNKFGLLSEFYLLFSWFGSFFINLGYKFSKNKTTKA